MELQTFDIFLSPSSPVRKTHLKTQYLSQKKIKSFLIIFNTYLSAVSVIQPVLKQAVQKMKAVLLPLYR